MAKYPYYYLKFVWRQLEFAFFGALTPVGALFILKGGDVMEYMGTKETAEKLKVKPATVSDWCREGRVPSAEQDAKGSPWRIPALFAKSVLLPKQRHQK